MKKANWIMMTLMVLALGVAIPAMTGCKRREPAISGSQAVQYPCPMPPEVVKDAPGDCPKCGMKLVQKH
jgi:membrane fusion protein, copper/silver efflux system